MLRCLVACGTEPTPGARAQEAARLISQSVGGLAGNPVDREIVKAIVALARAAGRRTVAEFVSDQDTLELLAELGVDLAQGFHIGRPRPLEEL
jgi:EAL domain-containing protein (putative c-di-GMP-specific phosphodiesterase class I)